MKRIHQASIIISLILVCLAATYKLAPITQSENIDANAGNQCRVILVLQHYKGSELVETRIKSNDLILQNFVRFWASSLRGNDVVVTCGKLKDTLGSEYYVAYNPLQLFSIRTPSSLMYIGQGTTAAALTNYVLESSVANQAPTLVNYAASGTQMNITVTTTFSFASNYAITEAGMSTWVLMQTGGAGVYAFKHILMLHDVFAAVNVESGDTLVVNYVWMFN